MERSSDHGGGVGGKLMRAAEYVRMSTEHQKYSTENPSEAIAAYAARRGFEIVKTYVDAGKSGLKLEIVFLFWTEVFSPFLEKTFTTPVIRPLA